MPYLSRETASQSSARDEAIRAIADVRARIGATPVVLDVGCGDGSSIDDLAAAGPHEWLGVDIPDSPEARGRRRQGIPIVYFDGTSLPFADRTIDVVYSRQVFEHVRHPELLLGEIARVLRPRGVVVGSTSHLEPFHSRSLWNFTPFGFATLLEHAGFEDVLVQPGVDAFSLIGRRAFALARIDVGSRWMERASPLNLVFDLAGRIARLSPQRLASVKLTFCGHFVFGARRSA